MKFTIVLLALVGFAAGEIENVEIQTDELGIGPYIVGGQDTTIEKV